MTTQTKKEEEILCGGCGKNDMRNYYKFPFPEDRCSDCEEEEVEFNAKCVICADYMSDVEEEDYNEGCNDMCDKCSPKEEEEWSVRGYYWEDEEHIVDDDYFKSFKKLHEASIFYNSITKEKCNAGKVLYKEPYEEEIILEEMFE